jgi:hypothetical protein
MSAPAIFVVGPEGSGTTLLATCIARHPALADREFWIAPPRDRPLPSRDAIVHLSLPAWRPMVWIEEAQLPADAHVVVIRRSPVHTVYSAYRRFFDRPRAAWQTYLRAVGFEVAYVTRRETCCVFYEDLVRHPERVLRHVYTALGVDGDVVPRVQLTDRNDERWRADPAFAGFMRDAFGIAVESPVRPAAPATLAFRCYGATIEIDDLTGGGVATALPALLPPNRAPIGGAAPDAVYRVERRARGAGGAPDGYCVLSDGEVRFRARSVRRIAQWLAGEVDRVVAETSREGLFVHAGVVAWQGRAIVIPGRSMTGKSTLVAELVRLGATYYSDEFAVLDDDGHVLPYARRPVSRDGRMTAEFDRGAVREAVPIGLVVSTAYRPGAVWNPEELHGVRAVSPIIDNTVSARQQTPRLMRVAAKVARNAVGLQGARAEAADVAPALLAYAGRQGGQVGTGPGRAGRLLARLEGAIAGATPEPDAVRPPRFVRIDRFLDTESHARFLAFARTRERDFVTSTVIDPTGTHRVDDGFRRSGTLHDLGELRPPLVAALRRVLPYVRRELGMPWFPVGAVEAQMAVHREGGFFGRHVDNGDGAVAERRITCVYYFHARPPGFIGGELRLYEGVVRGPHIVPGAEYVTVDPEDNTVVFFPSDTFHEVCPVTEKSSNFRDSRFSVTVWFRAGALPTSPDVADERVSGCAG